MLLAISSTKAIILLASGILILSYIFGIIAKRTNIPSVLMLIVLGIVMQLIWTGMGYAIPDTKEMLSLLGTVGLIMIVLEAALDLHLKKDKLGIIGKSLVVSLLGLVGCAFAIGAIFALVFGMETGQAIMYAVPLSILSSAIIIPSIGGLDEKKREFLILESTFSDILGIMMFYLVINLINETDDTGVVLETGFFLILLILFAIGISIGIVLGFKYVRSHGRYVVLLSALLALYALAKIYHLPALMIILVFGLVLRNFRIIPIPWVQTRVDEPNLAQTLRDSTLITGEAAFAVRSLFFVIFGFNIALGSLVSITAILVSAMAILALYFVRFLSLRLFLKNFLPDLFIAPRGLITILLFTQIPFRLSYDGFEEGILIYVILITGGVMTYALINKDRESALERFIWGKKSSETAPAVVAEGDWVETGELPETGEASTDEATPSEDEEPPAEEHPDKGPSAPEHPV